ncbi:hypothetical protein MRX96_008010 [Rhipicephalus microplus]
MQRGSETSGTGLNIAYLGGNADPDCSSFSRNKRVSLDDVLLKAARLTPPSSRSRLTSALTWRASRGCRRRRRRRRPSERSDNERPTVLDVATMMSIRWRRAVSSAVPAFPEIAELLCFKRCHRPNDDDQVKLTTGKTAMEA